jgi:hypothetical protein
MVRADKGLSCGFVLGMALGGVKGTGGKMHERYIFHCRIGVILTPNFIFVCVSRTQRRYLYTSSCLQQAKFLYMPLLSSLVLYIFRTLTPGTA